MRKLLIVFLCAMAGVLVIGYRYSPRSFARQEQTGAVRQGAGWAEKAFGSRNFTFAASQAILSASRESKPLNSWKNYVKVEPERLTINLYCAGEQEQERLIARTVPLDSCGYHWEMEEKKTFTFYMDDDPDVDSYLLSYDPEGEEAMLALVRPAGDTLLYKGAIYIH